MISSHNTNRGSGLCYNKSDEYASNPYVLFFRSPYLCSVIIKLRVIGPYKIRCYQVFPVETITVTPNPVIRRYELAEAS